MPIISVILPCYNAAETLPEALASLSLQTLTDFEVVAINDGSTDNTLEILQEWARQDTRFRILSLPHAGVIEASNAGIAACQAPYIARMDSDDHAHPHRLAQQVNFLDAHPEVAAVGCKVEGFPANEIREGFRIYIDWLNSLITDEDIRREMFVESPLANPSITFRRTWLEQMGGYQEQGWAEDYDLLLRLYLAGARFAKLPETLLEWRDRPDRLTRTDGRYSLENFIRAKAFYLVSGPLTGRDAVFIWGAGMMGRRLSKHLQRQQCPLAAFVDIDPRKIGHTRRGKIVLSPDELPDWWSRYRNPVLLAAVGARGARALIRQQLTRIGLREGQDWWSAA